MKKEYLLAEKLYRLLKEKSLTVSTAESCTGGLIGAALTSVPGMSECYGYGVVTYANSAKEDLLKVKETTLAKCGAVSPDTAKQMAEGVMALSGSDIAVSVTGICNSKFLMREVFTMISPGISIPVPQSSASPIVA